jgi:hypothetical protein
MASRNAKLAAALAGFSFWVAAIMAVYYLNMSHFIPLEMLIFPGVGVLFAALVIFSNTVSDYTQLADEVENWHGLLADDWEALQNWQFTRTHGLVLLVGIDLLALPALYTIYGKWDATWGGINVILIGTLVSVIVAVISFNTNWFQVRHLRLPTWVIMVPVIGSLFCAGLGIYFSETEVSSGPRLDSETGATYQPQSRGSFIYHSWFYADDFSSGMSISLPECDDKDCGYLYLGILLIMLVVILVLASAFIPNFWVLATLLLGTIYGIIVLRELLFSPRKAKEEEKEKRGQSSEDSEWILPHLNADDEAPQRD